MRVLKQSTARDLMVFMTDSADHVTGKTGLTLAITASKNGGAFSSISPTVTDRGSGWYSVALTTTHTNTLGDLALHVTASGADPTDLLVDVVAYDPQSATNLGLSKFTDIETDTQDIQSRLPAALVSGRIDASVGAMAANVMTAAAAAADLTTELQSGLATAASIAALNNLSTTDVSGAVWNAPTGDYTTPDTLGGEINDLMLDVIAIKAKTDSLTFTVAGHVDANIQYVNDIAVTGDGETGTEWGPA